MSIEAIEQRRAERRTAIAKARLEQYEKDLEQVDKLEVEHGDDRLGILEMSSFVAELPTLVVVKHPSEEYVRRYRAKVRKARKQSGAVDGEAIGAAADELGECSVIYPDKETYARMKREWPGIHDSVNMEAMRLIEVKGKD